MEKVVFVRLPLDFQTISRAELWPLVNVVENITYDVEVSLDNYAFADEAWTDASS
jgi:hypothetical protein